MSRRVKDFALLVGHAWRCWSCRESLLNAPEKTWIGYKLDETQRTSILNLSDSSFRTMMELSDATGIPEDELETAIEHPRARLRHIGSIKSHYDRVGNW